MSKRERIPHTARFLMTFHTAGAGLPADVNEERAAVEFVTGGAQTATATRSDEWMIEISGYQVKQGPGLVSEKQAKWIIDIATTRETPGPAEAVLIRLQQGFAKSAGSQFITAYKDLPRKAAPAPITDFGTPAGTVVRETHSTVAPGRYALLRDGVVKFYRVTEGKAGGRWAGRTFISAQASDDTFPIRNPQQRAEILAEIAKDPEAALCLYGRELGVCGDCGRTLTDETSREIGRGPVCRAK
jgi:hypothetical protein